MSYGYGRMGEGLEFWFKVLASFAVVGAVSLAIFAGMAVNTFDCNIEVVRAEGK